MTWSFHRQERGRESYLCIWLVLLNGKVGGGCGSSKLGGGGRGALLAPFVGIDAALQTNQGDLHRDGRILNSLVGLVLDAGVKLSVEKCGLGELGKRREDGQALGLAAELCEEEYDVEFTPPCFPTRLYKARCNTALLIGAWSSERGISVNSLSNSFFNSFLILFLIQPELVSTPTT